ncbi:MAG: 50S ribosomal protein L7/L12 [Candidatus Zixiibacteriota bacterium]
MATVQEMADEIVKLSALDLAELSKSIQDLTGVKPQAAVAVAAPAGGGAEAAEEKTEFDIVLTGFGDKKLQVIKTVRELTGLGLKEAKDLVEAAPSKVKEAVTKEEAETAKTKLSDAGAQVELK